MSAGKLRGTKMKLLQSGRLHLACIAVLLVLALPASAATEQLLRANNAGLHWVDNVRTADREASTVLRLNTPDGRALDMSLEVQLRLTHDATPHVAAVRDGRTQVFAGEIAGRPGSWARLTRIGAAWLGAVHDGEQLWFLDPASHHPGLASRLGVDDAATLVYTLADLAQPLDFHGDTAPEDFHDDTVTGHSAHLAVPNTWMPSVPQGSTGRELRITLVLDTEFQDLYPDAASVAVATLNVVDGFYAEPGSHAHPNTHLRLHHLVALADNGPLTMTDYEQLLPAFGTFVQDQEIPFHGVAHLFSGKVFDGSVIGYAWLNALCHTENGYGINQMTHPGGGRATLVAHELGHNFGVQHDNIVSLALGLTSAYVNEYCNFPQFIMYPSVSGANPATEFSGCSNIWFDHFTPQNQQCLMPLGLPFSDGFELNVLMPR